MDLASALLLLAIIAAAGFALRYVVRQTKAGACIGCHGGCAHCKKAGCAGAFKQDRK